MIPRSLANAAPSTGLRSARPSPRGPAASRHRPPSAHTHAPRPPRPGLPGTRSPAGVTTTRTSSPAGARRRHPTQVRTGPVWGGPPALLLLALDVDRGLLRRVERRLEDGVGVALVDLVLGGDLGDRVGPVPLGGRGQGDDLLGELIALVGGLDGPGAPRLGGDGLPALC